MYRIRVGEHGKQRPKRPLRGQCAGRLITLQGGNPGSEEGEQRGTRTENQRHPVVVGNAMKTGKLHTHRICAQCCEHIITIRSAEGSSMVR